MTNLYLPLKISGANWNRLKMPKIAKTCLNLFPEQINDTENTGFHDTGRYYVLLLVIICIPKRKNYCFIFRVYVYTFYKLQVAAEAKSYWAIPENIHTPLMDDTELGT